VENKTSPFVKLDEQVSLASSSARVVKTAQVGRVIGFGCHGAEQEALESLKTFAKNAREKGGAAAENFEQKLHEHVQKLEGEIAKSHKQRGSK
jgi:hypothetical protein